ncbi:MAG TPA: CARDB domain-containing protein [Polyangiaceae bacterium]|nr:CARDB domain-containing protein [Polyangiaceae bacterium]
MFTRWCRGFGFVVIGSWLAACGTGTNAERDEGSLTPTTGGTSSAGTGADGGTTGGTGAHLGTGGSIVLAGSGGTGAGTGGAPAEDPCKSTDCGVGQRCENQNGTASCVDKTCDEIACDDSELCQSAEGGGHVCVDKCTSDAACDEALHCDTTSGECVADDCTPDTRTCGSDDTIRVCASNGSPGDPIACGSAGYFTSECAADMAGAGACTCEDDWDCPAYMTCEAGTCIGTGVAPTCTLPATPFTQVLPQVEFRWGDGTKHSYTATDELDWAMGKAFPWSAQVVSPPLVINLDDDNGDGRADERDFPEILFITHSGDNRDTDGIVRAVHGGGPNKGQDFFALCGGPARPATPAATYADANGAYWSEGAAVTSNCSDTDENDTGGLARPSGALAAGDLDGDGFPEIVVPLETKGFQILSNRGEVLFTSPDDVFEPMGAEYVAPAPAIANLDFKGMPEIILGNRVIALTKDANGAFAIDKIYEASAGARGSQNQSMGAGASFIYGPTVCVADLTPDAGLEIAAGPTLYKLPASPPAGCGTVAMPCPLDTVWDARANLGTQQQDGLCAIADVLGACTSKADCSAHPPGPANPLDGKPEVVLISNGHLVILDGASGTVLVDQDLGGGDSGGAPNVDDFDGDGFPEIATALASFYSVIDLQTPDPTNCPAWDTVLDERNPPPQTNPPRNPGGACKTDADCTLSGTTCNEISGQCVCLHNGWKRVTEDDSSRVTSSSVFDFNGDGAAEVTYGDECYFRIYDGATGNIYLAYPSVSRTVLENPVIADVDNDGNAEIVFVQNNHFKQCDEGNTTMGDWTGATLNQWPTGTVAKDSLPTGITVLGDPTDNWVTARRVWNQHAYHVTNVLESGAIPLHEPESWKSLNGRVYNTYRSQPRNYGVAPDLTLTAIQISSPDAMCGVLSEKIEITVVVKNAGDLRVGPGVEVAFYGTWGGAEAPLDDGMGNPIVVVLDKSLEPGASTLVTVEYDVGNDPAPDDTALPDSVRVTIDGGNNAPDGKERECREDNNELTHDVNPGEALADLVAAVDDANCAGKVDVTVSNQGAKDASNVVVRVYAGDPAAGGMLLGETTIDSVAAGASASTTINVGGLSRNVTIWAIADPDDTIQECNDANNVVEGPALMCKDEPH